MSLSTPWIETPNSQVTQHRRTMQFLLLPFLARRPGLVLSVVTLLGLLSYAWPLFFKRADWAGWPPAALSAYLLGTVWASLVTCVGCAWLSSPIRNYGMLTQVAASRRGTSGSYAPVIIGCTAIGIAVQSIFFTIMLVTSAQANNISSPDLRLAAPLTLLISWAGTVTWAGVGTVLGRYVRAEVALACSLLLPYAAYVGPAFYLVDSPFLNATLYDGKQWLYVLPSTAQLIAKLLVWSGLSFVFLAIVGNKARIISIGSWLTVAGMTMVGFFGSAYPPVINAEDSLCYGNQPKVCSDRAHYSSLIPFRKLVVSSLSDLPADWRPTILATTGQVTASGINDRVVQAGPVDGYTMPALTINRDQTLAALGQAIFHQCPADGSQGDLAAASLEIWWRLENKISIDDPLLPSGASWLTIPELSKAPAMGQRLAGLDKIERVSWFTKNSNAFKLCRLGSIEWPGN